MIQRIQSQCSFRGREHLGLTQLWSESEALPEIEIQDWPRHQPPLPGAMGMSVVGSSEHKTPGFSWPVNPGNSHWYSRRLDQDASWSWGQHSQWISPGQRPEAFRGHTNHWWELVSIVSYLRRGSFSHFAHNHVVLIFFEDLIGFIEWFMRQAAAHLVNRREFPQSTFSYISPKTAFHTLNPNILALAQGCLLPANRSILAAPFDYPENTVCLWKLHVFTSLFRKNEYKMENWMHWYQWF